MPRGVKKEIIYTGKPLEIHNLIVEKENEIKKLKEDLQAALKEQRKEENQAKREAAKAVRAQEKELLKAMRESGKSPDEIKEMLKK